MSDLFSSSDDQVPADSPLADRLRPGSFDEVVGQDHLLGSGPLGRMVAAGKVKSLIFWGPPGTGKTTMARLLADVGGLTFVQISAIFSGVADLKKIFEVARIRRHNGQGTLLFVDEIHRFNRSQQDSFLPYVEDGTITLVGATTENPSFELNGALLSRMQVLVLRRLDEQALEKLLARAEALIGRGLPVTEEARGLLVSLADGDGRYLLNMVEVVFDLGSGGREGFRERRERKGVRGQGVGIRGRLVRGKQWHPGVGGVWLGRRSFWFWCSGGRRLMTRIGRDISI